MKNTSYTPKETGRWISAGYDPIQVFTGKKLDSRALQQLGFRQKACSRHQKEPQEACSVPSETALENADTACLVWNPALGSSGLQAIFTVQNGHMIRVEILDPETQEIYLPFFLAQAQGSYVLSVREAYKKLAARIVQTCSQPASGQKQKVLSLAWSLWQEKPDAPFQDHSSALALRESSSKKWYGLLLETDGCNLDSSRPKKRIQILNLRNPDRIPPDPENSIYPGWHMNHTSWMSIILDENMTDTRLMELVQRSRQSLLPARSSWIMPANPSFFDLRILFDTSSVCRWNQKAKFQPGDTVYIYACRPLNYVMYKIRVRKTHLETIHDPSKDPVPLQTGSSRKEMELEWIETYPDTFCTRSALQASGISHIRSARRISEETEKELFLSNLPSV